MSCASPARLAWGRLSVLEAAADRDDPAAGERRRSGKTPSTPDAHHVHVAAGPALAVCRPIAAGPFRPSRPPAPAGRYSTLLRAHGAQFPLRAAGHHPSPSQQRSRKACGDGVRARGSSPRTDSTRSGRSCTPARASPAASDPRSRVGSRGRRGSWRQGVEGPLDACCRAPSRSTTWRSWQRCWPGSCCCVWGVCIPRRLPQGAASRFRGGTYCGHCAGSRRADWYGAAIFVNRCGPASSSPRRPRCRSCAGVTFAPPPARAGDGAAGDASVSVG